MEDEEKRKSIVKNLSESRTNFTEAKKNITSVKMASNVIDSEIEESMDNTDRSIAFWKSFPKRELSNPGISSAIQSSYEVSQASRAHSEYLRKRTEEMSGAMGSIIFTVGTGSTTSSMQPAADLGVVVNLPDSEEKKMLYEQVSSPTESEKTNESRSRLESIDKRFGSNLLDDFNGMWQIARNPHLSSFQKASSHLGREIISELLSLLSPDEEVKKAEWFIPDQSNNGNPTMRQKAKFAVIGMKESSEQIEELKVIEEMSDKIRNVYQQLNPIAHDRNKNDEFIKLLKTYLNACQNIVLNLLDLVDNFRKPTTT